MSAITRPSLLKRADLATPFCSKDGQPCASVPLESIDARQVFPIRSAAFRDWLADNFHKETDKSPSNGAIRDVLRTLEARARYTEMPAQKVGHRVSFEGDLYSPSKVFFDLANTAGELIEITSQGWQTSGNLRHGFRQSPTALPLPTPTQPSLPLQSLRSIFNVATSADYTRCLAWLTAALRPTGPYPILVLTGPAGSGKSTLARILRELIDPSTAPIRRLPPLDRQLLEMAVDNWILLFDLVHRIPHRISEALCAVASGDALKIPQPDSRPALVFQLARPIILIAPQDETQRAWNPPRTLANRTITVHLPHIATPRTEAGIQREFQEALPKIFATLCDAVTTTLQRIRDIDVGNVARFPDSAVWVAAAAPALGLKESEIVDALANPASIWTGCDPLRESIHALLQQTGGPWTGDATTLLNELRSLAPEAALPGSARGLSQVLPGVSGIHIARSRNERADRLITITRILGANQQTATGNRPNQPPTH
jgi:putative DNA primase/helicase